MSKRRRKRFQVIEVPATGEGVGGLQAARITSSEDSPEQAVETARWGAFNNPGSARIYKVRDRARKDEIFTLDESRASHDWLFSVLYDGWQSLQPVPLSYALPGEWLHEDFYQQTLYETLFDVPPTVSV